MSPADDALDPAQRAAVDAGPGPLLIVAGPGSGKTRVVTHRVARLVRAGEDPSRILLLTFTQRAAREMVARLAALLDPAAARAVVAGTFHAICARLLREHGPRIGLRPDFGLLDPPGAAEVLADAFDATFGDAPGLREALPAPRAVLRILSLSLNADRPLAWALDRLAPRHRDLAGPLDRLCAEYCARKLEHNLLDYDDLLVFGHLLLTEDAALGDALARRFGQVLVDEYQDTNPVQARLVARLAGHHRNLCAVGDDAQAIYGFRGADVDHILRFAERWPDARVIRLGTNYRATPPLVALSNATLGHLRRRLDKTLRAAASDGPKPALVRLGTVEQEARFIASRACELAEQGVPLSAQAALYRAHAHARALQLELGRRGVPFTVRGGPRVFEQAHVRDVLAHLRTWANPLDVPAWRRVLRLRDGVGPATVERVLAALFERGDPWRALADDAPAAGLGGRARRGYAAARATLLAIAAPDVAGRTGPMLACVLRDYLPLLRAAWPDEAERRAADLRALAAFADGHDPAGLLEAVALADRLDDERPAGLVLSTMHQAKGLEWDAVYLMSLSEGRFPARLDGDLDEERRLFYVAQTRARRWLHLCCPARDGDGDLPRRISRFVAEVCDPDPTLVERWRVDEA